MASYNLPVFCEMLNQPKDTYCAHTYRFGVRPLLLRLRLEGGLGGHGVQCLLTRRHLARERVTQSESLEFL